jgi:hypothetical protein
MGGLRGRGFADHSTTIRLAQLGFVESPSAVKKPVGGDVNKSEEKRKLATAS